MSTSKKAVERFRTKITRVAGVFAIGFLAFCGSRWELKSPLIPEIFSLVGLACVSIAACGRLWCMLYIAGYKTQKLVVSGPYSLCRNPLYLFSFIGTLGIGLGSGTLTVPLVFMVAFILYYSFTVQKEEDRLLLIHGEAFKTYCEKTPRYLPSLKNFNEPEVYTVDPKLFRRHVGNALLWVCFFGVWGLFECLRMEKIIPTLLNLW